MRDVQILDVHGRPMASGQAYEGSGISSPELAAWWADQYSADAAIIPEKDELDARSQDAIRNDGYIGGARNIHVDNIVGHQFKLSAKPNWKRLRQFAKGFDETWADEFTEVVEPDFTDYAEDEDCWIDAQRKATFTELVRMSLLQYFDVGEAAASAEWEAERASVYRTCLQMVDPTRISNPNGQTDTQLLRKGVRLNRRGAPLGYHVRTAHPGDRYPGQDQYRWKYVRRYKPWGRLQFIHLFGNERPDQNRAVGDLVGALREIRTLAKLESVQLQNAVLNSLYAATLESDMDPATAFEAIGVENIGSGGDSGTSKMEYYLDWIRQYYKAGGGIKVNGLKVPVLPPGNKLKFNAVGRDAGMGSAFHQALLRHIAAQLNLPYEQFSRDFSKTSYSSARFGSLDSWKFFMSRRKLVPSRFATHTYRLWLEERMNLGDLPMPAGAPSFWEAKAAYSNCKWVGSGRGQIDEVKETNAAILRIAAGLSTLEIEVARFGEDWREVAEQRAKELGLLRQLGLPADMPKVFGVEFTRAGDDDDESPGRNDNDEEQDAA